MKFTLFYCNIFSMRKIVSLYLILFLATLMHSQVNTSYLWHLQQPVYWPEQSQSNPYHYQTVKESHDIKMSGGNNYSTGTSHPTNNLSEIFGNDDRKNIYQHGAKNSVQQLLGYPDAGAQVNYSGCLIENVNSLANANQWGYYSGWNNNYSEARSLTTSDGYSRLDIVGFTFHHAIAPLITERAFRKELQAHRLIYGNTFGNTPNYTKGYWPAECCFSVRNIKILVEEGFEWSVIANSHLSRTLNDYPLHYGTNGCNISPPNQADILSTNGNNWWNGQIDGRGGEFAAPYCYQAHKAQYIDPTNGTQYLIDVVPMCDLLSYRDGYSQQGTGDINNYIVPFNDPNHNSIVLFAHDGDNAWGGGSSYYYEAVPNFVSAAHSDPNLHPTTIQQFLHDNPVPLNDIIHVEDGGWVNAANDWGHPQFINWLWPVYDNSTHEFNPNGWTEDFRNWAVVTAIDNYACMAEDLEGGTDINDIVYPSASSAEAELAWHFYLPANASCYMYYGTAEDMEVKQTIAGNNAIFHAQNVIDDHPDVDNTPPSVFIPQRFPYNPGGREFGPIYGYQEHISSKDFSVWTLAYDVSGIQTAVLKYRVDTDDEINALTDTQNDTYTGGAGVSSWYSVNMTIRTIDPSYNAGNPDINFFVLPDAIADLYYAQITGLSDTLVDYYVEVTDTEGNIFKTPIQHVFVGNEEGGGTNNEVFWEPEEPTKNDYITVTCTYATGTTLLHWGVNYSGSTWITPNNVYWPANTNLFGTGPAVETPFTDPDNDGVFTVVLGPFNNAAQIVNSIAFVIHDGANWDNNGGSDYHITVNNEVSDNPTGANESVNMMFNETYNFETSDFTFQGVGGASFAGIKILTTVSKGSLKYNGIEIIELNDYEDVTLLSFEPLQNETGFPYTDFYFKVKDTQGRYSDNTYQMEINIYNYNPIGSDGSVTLFKNEVYHFSEDNFSYIGMGGATFNGIKITEVETIGNLSYNGNNVIAETDYPDVTLLTFSPLTDEFGVPYTNFKFIVKDSEGRYSDLSYTMTINVIENYPEGVSWYPEFPSANDKILIIVNNDATMTSYGGKLHWGVNKSGDNWTIPNQIYWTSGTVDFGDNHSVETNFIQETADLFKIELGPFNNSVQEVSSLHFVLHYLNNTWNNNYGADWNIPVQSVTIQTQEEKTDFIICPNPVKETANIQINGKFADYVIEILDFKGTILKSLHIGNAKNIVFRNNLNSGMYLIRLVDKLTGNIITKKIVIL